jgi:nicotinamide mononucleotide transporter
MDFCRINELMGFTPTVLNQSTKTHRISDSSPRRLLEWAAVICNVLFTVLYLNSNEEAFAMGILGPLFLLILCWREKLYAEPVLQLVYMISAVVGWYNVQGGWDQWHIARGTHVSLFLLSVGLAVVWGFVLQRYTSANFPKLDALVASWGMLATWLMMYQVHACWLYLIAVNVLSLFIYWKRRLYVAACMFVLYLVMAVDGYFALRWFEF